MQGFVLLVMLVYMQIIMLAASQAWLGIVDFKQYQSRVINIHELRVTMLNKLKLVDAQVYPTCILRPQSTVKLMRRSSGWWAKNACVMTLNDHQFYYIREYLSSDACAIMVKGGGAEQVAAYYRNTLYSVENRIYLQDTIIFPVATNKICDATKKTIRPGRQMLRWL